MQVSPKKQLGQHFLTDEGVAHRIAESLTTQGNLLEIGPGMGMLTKYLVDDPRYAFKAVELDRESVAYLHEHFPQLTVIEGDFLRTDLLAIFGIQQQPCSKDLNAASGDKITIIGNFPYNISSQILFRVYDSRDIVPEVVGMFQKEVAERVAAKPGSKTYGILSVLLSAYYDIEYLFTVGEHLFNPPPKVKSAVIRLRRNGVQHLDCDETLFFRTVKTGFNQRRKTLRNALKPLGMDLSHIPSSLLDQRAEQLSVADFVTITANLRKQEV